MPMWKTCALVAALALARPAAAVPKPPRPAEASTLHRPTAFFIIGRAALPPLVRGVPADDLLRGALRALDRAEREWRRVVELWEARLAAGEQDLPDPPRIDLGEALRLTHEALTEGGDAWANRHAGRYFLGWLLLESGEVGEARVAFEALLAGPAPNPYAQEAHLRLGEIAFDARRFAVAAAHYEASVRFGSVARGDVVKNPAGLSILALYKLAFTHGARGDEAAALLAIRRLLAVPVPADGDAFTSVRGEAIEYAALLLAEPDWDASGQPDPEPLAARAARLFPGDGPGDREVLVALVRALRNDGAPEAGPTEADLRARGLLKGD